jgi:hypothetical protein
LEWAPNITQVRILNGKSYREFQVEVRVHVHTCVWIFRSSRVCIFMQTYMHTCPHACVISISSIYRSSRDCKIKGIYIYIYIVFEKRREHVEIHKNLVNWISSITLLADLAPRNFAFTLQSPLVQSCLAFVCVCVRGVIT